MRAAFYIRVSTEEQTEYSPDAQVRALKEYSKKNRLIVNQEYVFIDEGISAKKTSNRPEFQRMIKLAKLKPRPFDIILVHKFDRFARNREDSVVFKALLRKECGIKVVSITENIEDDKFGIILEAILEAMAEYYSLNLSDEVLKGMTEKALRGGTLSRPPFGYSVVNQSAPPKPNENANVVKVIFQKFVDGWAPYKITKHLHELGIIPKTFSPTRIYYIIRNPYYSGVLRWNEIETEGQHTPIISKELFGLAQKQAEKLRQHRPPTLSAHILSGLIRCVNCKNVLSYAASKYPLFRCTGYSKGQCATSNSISVRKAENAVLEAIKHDAVYGKGFDFVIPEDDRENERINNQLQSIQRKYERVKLAYTEGIDTIEEYKANKLRIQKEEKELQERINNLETATIDVDKFKLELQRLYDMLIGDFPDEIKKETIRQVISQIVYDGSKKTLYIKYFGTL